MSALVKSACLAALAAPSAFGATLAVTNATPSQACLAVATWEIGQLCVPTPTGGGNQSCSYRPLPHWHGKGWQCLGPGESRSLTFDTSIMVGVQVAGPGDYVASHPLGGYAGTEQVWVAPGGFETRIAPLASGEYVATVSVGGGAWQSRQAVNREQLTVQLGALGLKPVSAWRLDRSFNVQLTSP